MPAIGPGASSGPPSGPIQPESLQVPATNDKSKQQYPVIGVGYTDHSGEPLPEVVLRPGSLLDSSRQQTAPPAEPQRLPPTTLPQ
jgi:hypothetical protein